MDNVPPWYLLYKFEEMQSLKLFESFKLFFKPKHLAEKFFFLFFCQAYQAKFEQLFADAMILWCNLEQSLFKYNRNFLVFMNQTQDVTFLTLITTQQSHIIAYNMNLYCLWINWLIPICRKRISYQTVKHQKNLILPH